MSLLKDQIELEIMEQELKAKNAFSRHPGVLKWLMVIFVLAIIPAYYTARSVSEKIWLNKYSQVVISAKSSFSNPLAIIKSDVSVTSLGNNTYAAAVKITNQNLNLSLENVAYSFNFYNAQKQQIYSFSDKLFLLPNQSKYLTVPTFVLTDKISYADFQTPLPQNLPWQKRLQTPEVQLITSIPYTSNQVSPPAFVVQGDFTNNSPYNLGKVRLTFILFDKAGKIIGSSQRNELSIAAYERRAYNQIWPNTAVNNLGHVEVTADTDTLDPNNISVPDSSNGPASDLSR